MSKRLLHVGPVRIANRISRGDRTDLSIEYLINSQPVPAGFLIMRLPAGTFEVSPVTGEEGIVENERKENVKPDEPARSGKTAKSVKSAR